MKDTSRAGDAEHIIEIVFRDREEAEVIYDFVEEIMAAGEASGTLSMRSDARVAALREARAEIGDLKLGAAALAKIRRITTEGLGITITFVDDAVTVAVGLAQRAVLAGLAQDIDESELQRMVAAAEAHREGHETDLGFPIVELREARAEEREACVKIAEHAIESIVNPKHYSGECMRVMALRIAAAICARKETS